jgi:hypothetical protein
MNSTPDQEMAGDSRTSRSTDWVSSSTTTVATSGSRYDTFTEAVPLSLSSLAHQSIPLNDGVLDGLSQVLQHTLSQCVNYARIAISPPYPWSFADLTTTPFAWTPYKREPSNPTDLPFALQKMSFIHQYTRNAWIYLKSAIPQDLTAEMEKEMWKENEANSNWSLQPNGILGRISLLYTTTEALTQGELDGTDTEDMPPCILYQIIVEYRSLPATGNQHAVQAEELSMLSFGGSVDDDVKYGALASLYDEHAKYVLEIYSVRGKKYKFDLMDSTLANGTIPRLPLRDGVDDPLGKSLCVTVTDQADPKSDDLRDSQSNNPVTTGKPNSGGSAITRMHLTMEGKLRQNDKGLEKCFESLPSFDYLSNAISCAFLRLNPNPPQMVAASPSGHTLVLDPDRAGDIYVNGRYVTTWGDDPGVGSHGVALFSMDLHSVPFWNGRIVDYEAMKEAYAQLWHEVLVDARLLHLNIAKKLLYRLMKGVDPQDDEDDDGDWYDTDGEDETSHIDTHKDCLESLVLAAPQYDRVGIAAKALATRFAMEFGKDAFPCLPHETEWVKNALPDREPVVVPQRLINILRRGGYFDTQKTADLLWFTDSRPARDAFEAAIVTTAVRYLEEAGCTDVDSENIVFVEAPVADNAIAKDAVCRWNTVTEQFYVHQGFMTAPIDEYRVGTDEMDETRIKGYLLGMYIAKAHPAGFGKVLARYLIRNNLS